MASRREEFVVGIDLGTTHSAMASSPRSRKGIEVLPIPQLVGPGDVASLPLLPSALYLPSEGELPEGATRLPWGEPEWVAGEWARRLGARIPSRLVFSAKSWLSHPGADRTAPILPWGAPEEVSKLSPVEASARVLSHLRHAWESQRPNHPLSRQEVILTIPASFDEVARELTVQAAREAGLENFRLLEEPQAAFYDYLLQEGDRLEERIGEVRLVLVLDVGGGTTDFTLIRVERREGGPPRLERVAVGDHLMLGGDNMDVTLARHVEGRMGERLSHSDWAALVQSCRIAKETLLSGKAPESYQVAIPGTGRRLVGGARTLELSRDEAQSILLDGFLPRTRADEGPERRRMGLTELGLPYASDPAISRHLNAFLRRHAQAAAETGAEIQDGLPRPDAVLLNGGVFNAPEVMRRLSQVLEGWFGAEIPLLSHPSLDLAVARGAAYYGLVRHGLGVRIEGGSPRSYYLGIEGGKGEKKALCVVPKGMEEGTSRRVETHTFQVLVGQPVRFPLYTSTRDRFDPLGEIVDAKGLDALPPLHTVLQSERAEEKDRTLPVRIASSLTEIGTLELHLESLGERPRKWRLEFSLRGQAGGGAEIAPIQELPPRFAEARALVERAYGGRVENVDPREIKQLWRRLEKTIGERDGWSSAVNRELWGVVFAGAKRRRRSPDHERVFFQLAGYCLRPGYGAPLDAWRVEQLWKLFEQGVQYTKEKANWSEWWILWRRVSGGLPASAQRRLFQWVTPWLEPPKGRVAARPKGPKAEGFEEMVRMLGALERLSPEEKERAAGWIFHRLEKEGKGSYWPIGRLGARQPLYGSVHDVVPAEVAAGWLEKLLELDWNRAEGAAFAAARIATRTGDRNRDLPEEVREEVAARLRAIRAPDSWQRLVIEGGELSEQDRVRVFGDTLPVGLRIGPADAN